jgi:hypothetical protein
MRRNATHTWCRLGCAGAVHEPRARSALPRALHAQLPHSPHGDAPRAVRVHVYTIAGSVHPLRRRSASMHAQHTHSARTAAAAAGRLLCKGTANTLRAWGRVAPHACAHTRARTHTPAGREKKRPDSYRYAGRPAVRAVLAVRVARTRRGENDKVPTSSRQLPRFFMDL